MLPRDEEPTVLVTYRDGSTELRPASSPMRIGGIGSAFTLPPQHITSIHFYRNRDGTEGWWIIAQTPTHPSETDHAYPLNEWHGWNNAIVWRITGGMKPNEALSGEWAPCDIESIEDRVLRLTREVHAARGEIRRRLEANVAVVPLNNNGPRVLLRGAPVEIVRHHRALADMRLPDNVKDALRIRDDVIAALVDALSVDDPMPPYVMVRDLQEVPRGPALDVPDALANEVEEHRATQDKLRAAETYVEELKATNDALAAERDTERARADAAELERDEVRVEMIDALTVYGWREDNGGFVSVKDLGGRMLMCATADHITFLDMLSDHTALRNLRRADAEPKPTVSLVADNDRMRRRLRAIACDNRRKENAATQTTNALTAWAEDKLEEAGWVRHGIGWILSSDRDMRAALSLEEAVRWQANQEALARSKKEPEAPKLPAPPDGSVLAESKSFSHTKIVLQARATFGNDVKVAHGMFVVGTHGGVMGFTHSLIAGVCMGDEIESSKDHVAVKATIILVLGEKGAVVTDSPEDFISNPRQWFPPKAPR